MLHRSKLVPLAVLLLVGAWIFWLRWPSFGWEVWNLDEGIHATVGRAINEGGVMYRDAIDIRTPLSHYIAALVYAVAGINNQWAFHATVAGFISLTALAIFLVGRRWRGAAVGIWAAFAFAALCCSSLHVIDAYAAGTEWFLIFFATWGAWTFLATWQTRPFRGPFLAGSLYAGAFLSKQPGLLDVGTPLAFALYLGVTRRVRWTEAARLIGAVAAGFGAALAPVFAYFWLNGALDDFYFYAWTFNVVYYTSATTFADWLQSVFALGQIVWVALPMLVILATVGIAALLRTAVQKVPSDEDRSVMPHAVFLLLWIATSLGGAAMSGRVYGHYYIQAFPALALAIGWVLGCVMNLRSSRALALRLAAWALLAVAAWQLAAGPIRQRARPGLAPEGGKLPAEFVKQHTNESDKIFVWGFDPDFYLFADRGSASKFLYCTFITGLIPGVNTGAGVDTRDAAIPHLLDELMSELERNKPAAFIDASVGQGRFFNKYPLWKYPRLAQHVAENYVEVEAARFRSHGFRVLLRRDAARGIAAQAAGTESASLEKPTIAGLPVVDPGVVEFTVRGTDAAGKLSRLELLANGKVIDGVTFHDTELVHVTFPINFAALGQGRHELVARSTDAAGNWRNGEPFLVECATQSVTAEQRQTFAIPTVSPGAPPHRVHAPYGAKAAHVAGVANFAAHAPSTISYALLPNGARLRGYFGLEAGAYAPTNTGATDGAEFIITWVKNDLTRQVLFRRLLRPVQEAADRGRQPFDVVLPDGPDSGMLEFEVSPGPQNSPASDWAYWNDVMLVQRR